MSIMVYSQVTIIALVVVGCAYGDAPAYPGGDVHSNQVAPGASHYPSASAPAPVIAQAPAPAYTKWAEDDQTIHLQSGYEGYLVPAEPSPSLYAGVGDFLRTAGLVAVAPPLGKIGLKFALKFGVWFLGFAALFLLGSFVTTAVCTLTPLCTISFIGLGPFSKETVRTFVSEDRLNSATQFVYDAIKKYRNLNKKSDEEDKSQR